MLTELAKHRLRDSVGRHGRDEVIRRIKNGECLLNGGPCSAEICHEVLDNATEAERYVTNLRPNRDPTREARRKARWWREKKAAARSLASVQEVS